MSSRDEETGVISCDGRDVSRSSHECELSGRHVGDVTCRSREVLNPVTCEYISTAAGSCEYNVHCRESRVVEGGLGHTLHWRHESTKILIF